MSETIAVLVAGCGHMGTSHAYAYKKHPGFHIAGLVSRGPASRKKLAEQLGGGVPLFDNYDEALKVTKPEAVSINTYPDTHAEFAIKALRAGAHVFVEKPLAETPEKAEEVVNLAKVLRKKVVVGYILRHHPAWKQFVELAQTLGKPLVMRMNLNQQSKGDEWNVHKNLMRSLPPIVDCGVHYVDVMCQMTRATPVRVQAIGAKLTDEIAADMYNYGQLQVVFDDGSVGWYEAGWGPMMSETAFFVKDVIGPKGCVSIVKAESNGQATTSANVSSHTRVNTLKQHFSQCDEKGEFIRQDVLLDVPDEPNHDELCEREQRFFYDAIIRDTNLSDHLHDAVNSLRIVLAADKSVRTARIVEL
jgi:predicted dehydrogenase